jgi:hypothetical protein
VEATPASAWDEVPVAGASIALPPQGGLDLAALAPGQPAPLRAPAAAARPAGAAPPAAEWMKRARELFALGDFSGSLELIERTLAVDPHDAEALAYLQENEETLVEMYESRLGPLTGVPSVRLRPEEVVWLNLDHRAGFVLAQVDGHLAWDDVFALAGLPRLETARILVRLMDEGVIGVP